MTDDDYDDWEYDDSPTNTPELTRWLWITATIGSVLLSFFGLLVTSVLAVVLYGREVKRQAIAAPVVSLIVVMTVAYLYLSNA